MTVRNVARGAVERVLSAAPRRTTAGDRLILAYHNVVPCGAPMRGDRSLHLPVDRFEAQLRCLRQEADVVPLLELLQTNDPRARRVAITFDDAYASALALGVTACVAHGVPCTVFVAPALLGTVPIWDAAAERGQWSVSDRHRFLWEQKGLGKAAETEPAALRIATETELAAAEHAPGVTLGNHTMHHANLGALSTAEACAELAVADAWLRVRFPAATVPVVAYPYGIAPQDAPGAVLTAGLSYGLAVSGGWWLQRQPVTPLSVPRWNVPASLSIRGFQLRLRGWIAEA
jgi:peptidoglycan/xylan/chitin deacetylase (PgdA/CDA1 family)